MLAENIETRLAHDDLKEPSAESVKRKAKGSAKHRRRLG
jgi:hypothetical protein